MRKLIVSVSSDRLAPGEASRIWGRIAPIFPDYLSRYDTDKYPPEVYDRVREAFARPTTVTADTLREAILWKYGHSGKPAIPRAHEQLILQVQRGWPAAVAVLPNEPEQAFDALNRQFGGPTRFITTAFLLHLLHPRTIPIIDQHNFRAVNEYIAECREGWKAKKKPSAYADIVLVSQFMDAVLKEWKDEAPRAVPIDRDFDKFLMMYGKELKRRLKGARVTRI